MLTSGQKDRFREDGFLHLPGLVPREKIDRALQAIYHRLGQGIPTDQLRTWQAQSFFPDLAREPVITDLYNESGLLDIVRELMGAENAGPLGQGQLALRFPREPGTVPRPPGPHIDGIATPHNGVTKGTLSSFSALAGVFLTAVQGENAGNFTVWPGSHRRMEEYFQQHGIQLLLEGVTPNVGGEPHQIKAQPGDAVLAHYQLLHGVAANVAPCPRFAVFFRVKHPMHNEHRLECLTDLWKEWDGMREAETALA